MVALVASHARNHSGEIIAMTLSQQLGKALLIEANDLTDRTNACLGRLTAKVSMQETVKTLDDRLALLEREILVFSPPLFRGRIPMIANMTLRLETICHNVRATIARIRQLHSLLERAAELLSSACLFLELKKTTDEEGIVSSLDQKMRELKHDISAAGVVTMAKSAGPTDLPKRLMDACHQARAAILRIHQVLSIFRDLKVIEQKRHLLTLHTPTETSVDVFKETCLELRALFTSVRSQMQTMKYSLFVDPQKEYEKLLIPYLLFDQRLVSMGLLPPLIPLISPG